MSKPQAPDPVKLFLSAIYNDPVPMDKCIKSFMERFGAVDFSSRELPFLSADYYHAEMGKPLKRRYYTFKNLVNPGDMIDIKLFTNSREQKTACEGNRCVNLDPGVVSMINLVLATGKPASHRPYLGRGIYADLALVYERGSFQSLPWTYPDYMDREMIAFMNRIREAYKADLKEWKTGNE